MYVFGAMAAPLITQTMWLLLTTAASVGVDIRSAQQDFPQLAHVIYSICGLADVDVSSSNPCAYRIFGMAYAFTECGVVHQADFSNFKSCVLGCSTDDRCATACSDPKVKNANCLSNCKTMASCIDEAASNPKSTGQVSATRSLNDCFGRPLPVPAPPPPGAVAAPAAAAPGAAAPAIAAPAAALLAMGTNDPASPAPASYAAAPAPSAPSVDSFKQRKGILSKKKDLVPNKCVCTKTGIVNGKNTGQKGCAKHGKEPDAGAEAYCFVSGGFSCGGSMASIGFPGLFWVNCEKPDFALLYPPQCEILKRATAKLFVVPPPLGLKAPPANFDAFRPGMVPMITAAHPLDTMSASMGGWASPMHPTWHEQRGNYFAKEAFQAAPAAASAPAGAVAASPFAAVAASPGPAMALSQLRGVQQHGEEVA